MRTPNFNQCMSDIVSLQKLAHVYHYCNQIQNMEPQEFIKEKKYNQIHCKRKAEEKSSRIVPVHQLHFPIYFPFLVRFSSSPSSKSLKEKRGGSFQ